jgi:acyl-CoA thioesterase FadM
VRLSEIDVNWHMNQAAYLQVAELSRTDWVLRSGVWSELRAQGIKPVVADQQVVYRRELKPLERYQLDTRAVAVDGRLLAVETHFLVADLVHARVTAKLIFLRKRHVLTAGEAEALCTPWLIEPLAVERFRVVA